MVVLTGHLHYSLFFFVVELKREISGALGRRLQSLSDLGVNSRRLTRRWRFSLWSKPAWPWTEKVKSSSVVFNPWSTAYNPAMSGLTEGWKRSFKVCWWCRARPKGMIFIGEGEFCDWKNRVRVCVCFKLKILSQKEFYIKSTCRVLLVEGFFMILQFYFDLISLLWSKLST